MEESSTNTTADSLLDRLNQAHQTLENILQRMGFEVRVYAETEGDCIRLRIDGDDAGLLIGKKGQTLDALQLLVSRIVNRGESTDEGTSAERKQLIIDSSGYREKRADSLVQLAHRLKEKAVKTGRIIALNPMNARDRRVIHVTLRDSAEVSTMSEGEGESRRLLIVPSGARLR